MSQNVDKLLQDSSVRLTTTKKYATELAVAGINPEFITQLEGKIGVLRAENTAFNEAKNRKFELTESQKVQVKTSQDVIRKFRASAQIAFYDDKVVLKEFGIGKDIPSAVKALSTELPNLKEVAGRCAEKLATAGITAADIAALETSTNELVAIDQEQEESKNAQKTQKTVLDAAAKTVKELMFKVNKAASIVFMHDKAKLDEFKSIFPKSKTEKTDNGTTTTPETGTNP
ncbi:MAG: hypothetical protein WC703_10695 [Candidatus Neomarinimicrobiota bacterium]